MNSSDWKNATVEQKILWNHAKTKIAYTTITPIFYQGGVAGSEFVNFFASKLYIALEVVLSNDTAVGAGVPCGVYLYNELDALASYNFNLSTYWDPTVTAVQKNVSNQLEIKNTYFSRLFVNNYAYIKFIGYRLNV